MRYFIMALLLHGLLFLKLSMPSSELELNNLPVKHSVTVQFQQVSSLPPPPPPPPAPAAPVEKPVEKKIEKPKETPKEKPVPKKKTSSPVKEKRDEKPVTAVETSASNVESSEKSGVIGGVAGGVPGGIPGGILEANGDGTYNALSGHGIKYKIIREVKPEYPKQAENIRYRKKVVVKARFLVDQKGEVKNISIIHSHSKLGFDQAVITALNRWKFSPIIYEGEVIKVYFQKEFVFEPKI